MAPIFEFSASVKEKVSSQATTVRSRGSCTSYHGSPGYWPEGMQDLTSLLCRYDAVRHTLEQSGGGLEMVSYLTHLLNYKCSITGPLGEEKVMLSQPDYLRSALVNVGQSDIKFNVRRLDHGLPAYYVARIHLDWWGIYSLIVEDIHLSPGYPLLDRRFARIMQSGRERYYLRLSLFREAVGPLFSSAGEELGLRKDTFLYELGRCIFQGAWHLDQRFAFLFSETFEVPRLRNAFELIYLCLSSDLSALRRFLTPEMQAFFDVCHPNPGISRLLACLGSMNAAAMGDVKHRALDAYRHLVNGINEAFAAELPWPASWHGPIPLWKIVVANINRLEKVREQIGREPGLAGVIQGLDAVARTCIAGVLEEQK